MSQLNNNCESGLTCFEALPLALTENKRERVSVYVLFVYVCMCGSRLMRDHLEESGFGNTIFHAEWTCAVLLSLEKVKMEGGREAKILSYFSLV